MINKTKIANIITFVLFSTGLYAVELDKNEIKVPINTEYKVIKGDTLWDISEKLLKNPMLWLKVWENNDQIKDSNLIYPGDIIYFEKIDSSNKNNNKVELKVRSIGNGEDLVITPSKRYIDYKESIPNINFKKIKKLIKEIKIVDPENYINQPYIVGSDSESLLLNKGDYIYVVGLDKKFGDFDIFKNGQKITNEGELLGHQIEKIGSAKIVDKLEDSITKLKITSLKGEISNGHRIYEKANNSLEKGFISFPDKEVNSNIISIVDGVRNAGLYDTVILNTGNDQLKIGDVLNISKKGKDIYDSFSDKNISLPNKKYGQIIIIDTFEHLSVAIVINTKDRVNIMDIATSKTEGV